MISFGRLNPWKRSFYSKVNWFTKVKSSVYQASQGVEKKSSIEEETRLNTKKKKKTLLYIISRKGFLMEINLLFLLKSRKLFLLPFSINIHTVFNTKNTEEIVTLLTSPKIPRQSDNRWIATNFKIIEKYLSIMKE